MQGRDARLILASGSPQRSGLLRDAGYAFRVIVPGPTAECGVCSRESPGELVTRLARQKAADVAEQLRLRPDAPNSQSFADAIVACDTLCECQGRILGKPAHREHARAMLETLSGREHHVFSGLCVWPLSGGHRDVQIARTTLRMDRLDSNQIDEYVASGQWEGKAGAFGYQDRVGWLHIVEGSESNVIGLPMELLAEMLAKVKARGAGPPNP